MSDGSWQTLGCKIAAAYAAEAYAPSRALERLPTPARPLPEVEGTASV